MSIDRVEPLGRRNDGFHGHYDRDDNYDHDFDVVTDECRGDDGNNV